MLARRLFAAAIAASALAVLPSCSGGGGGYEMTAYFDKAVSLYPHSDVKILGLAAGTIDEVEVVGDRVRVRMTIDEGVPVPADVRAAIVPFSLIGERYVQLFPAWTEGQPRAFEGTVIPVERTTVPVEPDEALAALKRFLDTLDPNATGRLVRNLAADLEGQGGTLNDALAGLAQLVSTLAEKDAQLVGLVENFDRFTATLRAREDQLGKVMDQFANLTRLLAKERGTVERLVRDLAQVSRDGLDLVARHGPALHRDIQTVTDVLHIVDANFDELRRVLDATPLLVAGQDLDGKQGLAAGYDPTYKHLDLRNSTTPTLARLFETLGLPVPIPRCLPIDVECEGQPGSPGAPARASRSAGGHPAPPTTTPVDAVVDLLGSSGSGTGGQAVLARWDEPDQGQAGGLLAAVRRGARALVEAVL